MRKKISLSTQAGNKLKKFFEEGLLFYGIVYL